MKPRCEYCGMRIAARYLDEHERDCMPYDPYTSITELVMGRTEGERLEEGFKMLSDDYEAGDLDELE